MKKNPTLVVPDADEVVPSADEVSPDAETVLDEAATPVPVRARPDPLDAAEQALARAAQARGVPLELPERIVPDRTDVFAAAERALATARKAREAAGPGHAAEQKARRVLAEMKAQAGGTAPSDDGSTSEPKRKKRDL